MNFATILGYAGMLILLASIYLLGRNEHKLGWSTQIVGDFVLFVYSILLQLNVFIILEAAFTIVASWNFIKLVRNRARR
ncbi:hypothetical protein [Candidatus Mancarchaeum acidiphilum]|uniref:hypothetical protein n=1 Tax=Candidatus Mancarchaeum acidiphilum TaxID=1920749 RepID=UPI000B58D03F|nr:hypothetical protein [Candidatus Mancarchaeum acidiphilum]